MVKQEDSDLLEDRMGGDMSPLLPVLYVEDGKAILRFSEIFGVHVPLKTARKRESRYIISKGVYALVQHYMILICSGSIVLRSSLSFSHFS